VSSGGAAVLGDQAGRGAHACLPPGHLVAGLTGAIMLNLALNVVARRALLP
jgi:uncharacterized cupredoxin-like copper-binding protein